jgi:hypothetical protein
VDFDPHPLFTAASGSVWCAANDTVSVAPAQAAQRASPPLFIQSSLLSFEVLYAHFDARVRHGLFN